MKSEVWQVRELFMLAAMGTGLGAKRDALLYCLVPTLSSEPNRFLGSVFPFARCLQRLNTILPCMMFSRENIITFCCITLKEFGSCWDQQLLFPVPHQTPYNSAPLCIILFQTPTIGILRFMQVRQFGWLYFITALEKQGREAAELSLYGFALLKSGEETVVLLLTCSALFHLWPARAAGRQWLSIFLSQWISAAHLLPEG